MPFTFSHPAIVLPLLKKKRLFSATGLVIGSVIPDFESFIYLREWKIYGHTWPGIFWFDLPLAIAFSFIFHGVIRNPLINNLPDNIGSRFLRTQRFNWPGYFGKHIVKVVVSMIIGITLHLLWDAFTHLNLKDPDARDANVYAMGLNVYIILQYVSSAIGMAAVIWYIFTLPKMQLSKKGHSKNTFYIAAEKPAMSQKGVYWTIFFITAAVAIGGMSFFVEGYKGTVLYIEFSISAMLLSLTVAGFVTKLGR